MPTPVFGVFDFAWQHVVAADLVDGVVVFNADSVQVLVLDNGLLVKGFLAESGGQRVVVDSDSTPPRGISINVQVPVGFVTLEHLTVDPAVDELDKIKNRTGANAVLVGQTRIAYFRAPGDATERWHSSS